jgi:hypothetical protein
VVLGGLGALWCCIVWYSIETLLEKFPYVCMYGMYVWYVCIKALKHDLDESGS